MKRMGIASLALAFVALGAMPMSSRADTIAVETEDFVDYYNIGGNVIQSVPGPGCSGGNMLIGLDVADEWTSYNLLCDESGFYSVTMRCRGDYLADYELKLIFTPVGPGETQTVTLRFTGRGYG
jgi:hypothetical protein